MRRVSLSRAAESDLEAIDEYTIEHFGLDQAIKTTGEFRRTFRILSEMPMSAPLAKAISPDYS